MNIQTLHIALLILISIVFVQQATKKTPSEMIQSSQYQTKARTAAEDAARAAEEAMRAAEAASEAPTENLGLTIDDHISFVERAATEEVVTTDSDTAKLGSGDVNKINDAEKISIFTRSNTSSTLNCEGKDVDLLPDGLNITLVGQCARVSISGPSSVVNIANAKSVQVMGPGVTVNITNTEFVQVSGPSAVVKVGRVDHIRVPAPNAKVYYSGTLTLGSNTPQIEVFGPNATVNRQ